MGRSEREDCDKSSGSTVSSTLRMSYGWQRARCLKFGRPRDGRTDLIAVNMTRTHACSVLLACRLATPQDGIERGELAMSADSKQQAERRGPLHPRHARVRQILPRTIDALNSISRGVASEGESGGTDKVHGHLKVVVGSDDVPPE